MNLKNITAMLIACVLSIHLCAQDKDFKFGNVPEADIKMLSYDPEPDAEAVVLGNTLELTLNLVNKALLYYSYHKRIKILKESAYDLGTVTLYYYSKDNIENIKKLKAVITYPDGTQYKLSKSEFYKDEFDDRYETITFTYPKLTEGAIIEYSYDLVSEQVTVLDDFIYQEKYPVRYAHVRLQFPENIDYAFVNKGSSTFINRADEYLLMDSIPSMKEESYVTTMDDYRGTIKIQIKGYRSNDGVYHPILSSWEELTKDLEETTVFGEQYLKKFASNKIVKEVKEQVDPSLKGKELIQRIQEVLLEKVSCNMDNGIYSTDNIINAWKEGVANRTEMNFMMIAVLRSYDIPAYPMLVSTRSHGKVLTTYPFLNQFSYAIVKADLEGKPFLIDVSDKHRPPGIVSFDALNYEGFVVNSETKGGWQKIEGPNSMDVFFCQFQLEEDQLKGTIKGKYTNYNALPERRQYDEDESGKHWEDRLREKFPDATVENVKFDDGKGVSTPLKDELMVVIPDACVVANDIMYIDPYVYSNYTENPFKLKERNFPVDFGNPRGEQYIAIIDIPEGYEVEEIPEGTSIVTPDRMANYNLTCSVTNNKININRKIEFKKPFYSPDEYLALKKIFDMMLEKDGEQIVLKKSNP